MGEKLLQIIFCSSFSVEIKTKPKVLIKIRVSSGLSAVHPWHFSKSYCKSRPHMGNTHTKLCAHLQTIQFSSERQEKTLLNLKKNDNIMWRQCAEKIDFYQEVLLLEGCSVL